MRNNIFKILFAAWVLIWIFFTLREITIKNNLKDYKVLISRSLEGKRSYVTGDELYEFLTFCNNKLPPNSSYMWTKTDKEDHYRRRSTYYLYPHLEKDNAGFVLVYNEPNFTKAGYIVFAKLDRSKYILIKKENS